MRALIAAALVLGGVAATAHGAPPGTCAPAPPPVAAPKTGFEVHLYRYVEHPSVVDGEGRRDEAVPGVGLDDFDYGQLELSSRSHRNVRRRGRGGRYGPREDHPLAERLAPTGPHLAPRRAGDLVPDEAARTGLVTLAFASGEPLGQVRLCVNGTAIPPTTVATHGFALDMGQPAVTAQATLLPGEQVARRAARDRQVTRPYWGCGRTYGLARFVSGATRDHSSSGADALSTTGRSTAPATTTAAS